MGKRIRRGTLTIGSSVSDVSNFEWNDSHEFDRSKADDEWSGTPVEMNRAGSGSFTLLAGSVATGYATSNVVFVYTEVEVTSGVESTSTKTHTFTGVTFNMGGSVPAEGKGEIRISFDYSSRTTGKVQEGRGEKSILVNLTKDCALLIHPQRRVDISHTAQDELSPEGVDKIVKALEPLKSKEVKAEEKEQEGETK